MSARYRCRSCGNLTRFDVTVTRRTREYHHFSVGGDLEVEDRELLSEIVEEVACRWCAATGDSIESVALDAAPDDAAAGSLVQRVGEP